MENPTLHIQFKANVISLVSLAIAELSQNPYFNAKKEDIGIYKDFL